MGVDRFGQAQQGLQQALDVGGGQQVFAPRHQGHLLMGVVHHHRQMIRCRHVLARDHDIAKAHRVHRMAMAMLAEG
jgi:hypothetical protein